MSTNCWSSTSRRILLCLGGLFFALSSARASESDLRIDAVKTLTHSISEWNNKLLLSTFGGSLYLWPDPPNGQPVAVKGFDGNMETIFHPDISSPSPLREQIFLCSSDGLYRWNTTLIGEPKRVPGQTGSIKGVMSTSKGLVIGSEQGLFLWKAPFSEATPPDLIISKPIRAIDGFSNRLLIGTDRGLLCWKLDSQPVPTASAIISEPVDTIIQLGSYAVVGCKKSVWILHVPTMNVRPILLHGNLGSAHKTGNILLISANSHLYQLDLTSSNKPKTLERGGVWHFRPTPNGLLLGAIPGLFRWTKPGVGRPERVTTEIENVFQILEAPFGVILGTDKGAYRWEAPYTKSPEQIPGPQNDVFEIAIYKQTVLFGVTDGLYRWDGLSDRLWKAGVVITSKTPSYLYGDNSLFLSWTFTSTGWHETRSTLSFKITATDQDGKKQEWTVHRGETTFTIPKLEPGNYSIKVVALDKDLHTSTEDIKSVIRINVRTGPLDVWLQWIKGAALSYAFLNPTTFLLLLLFAKKSDRAHKLLLDQRVRGAGLYFSWAIIHVRPIRTWVFERYYARLKSEFGQFPPYLPLEITARDSVKFKSTEMALKLIRKSKIWLIGEAGSGKTEVCRYLIHHFVRDNDLRTAYKRFGFIPILVPVRELSHLKVVEAVRTVLRGHGVEIAELELVDDLLNSGSFLIMLDGMNEGEMESQVNEFVVGTKDCRMLLTSQSFSENRTFEVQRLPSLTPSTARSLLKLFLADRVGENLVQSVPESTLTCLTSVYDVLLVEELLRSGVEIPKDRIGLYNAVIGALRSRHGMVAKISDLYRAGWFLWSQGLRRIEELDFVTVEMMQVWKDADLIVQRGSHWEFRHDLVRSYLAACWVAKESPTPHVMASTLSEESVWKLPSSEQTDCFNFLCDLLEDSRDFYVLSEFALSQVTVRINLLAAIQRSVNLRGLPLDVSL